MIELDFDFFNITTFIFNNLIKIENPKLYKK